METDFKTQVLKEPFFLCNCILGGSRVFLHSFTSLLTYIPNCYMNFFSLGGKQMAKKTKGRNITTWKIRATTSQKSGKTLNETDSRFQDYKIRGHIWLKLLLWEHANLYSKVFFYKIHVLQKSELSNIGHHYYQSYSKIDVIKRFQ